MKSGFLFSSDPKVSKLSDTKVVNDDTLGKRKYRLDDFEFERNIGSGNLSEVWHVTLKARPKESYALKIFNVQKVKQNNHVKYVQQERTAMLHLNSPGHPNVIRMIDTFRDDNHVYLLYEYADGGELWEEIKNIGVPDKSIARVLVWQLLNGLEYIHNRRLIHRDIKCENIVIQNGILKFIDFGTSKFFDGPENPEQDCANTTQQPNAGSSKGTTTTDSNVAQTSLGRLNTKREFENYVGTPNFMPPEAISNQSSGYAGDLWSFGCTIYQLLLGMNCFIGSSSYFIYKNVKGNKLGFPQDFDLDAKDLIENLIVSDPNNRMTLADVRRHKYFAGIDDAIGTICKLKRFDSLDVESRSICSKVQEAIFDLTIKREGVTDTDYEEIEELIESIRQRGMTSMVNNLLFNYLRMREQLAAEIDEANLYMRE
ncbi:AGC kinase [Babesia ovis]|uniref:non-specific serine/threonine protein kinase n=1 Tax=Babesia ovis TaxID=5869 RepID=A0A9W5T7H3_BABOV|nr:AGC kinase [Babesia ovis]